MVTILWIIYILDSLLLIGIILLQPGEGGDLAAAFGGASSQTAFGARGSATFLQKLTTGLAVLFMVLSIVLVIATNWKQKNIMEKNPPAVQNNAASTAKPGAATAKPGAAKETPAPAKEKGAATATESKPQSPATPAPKPPEKAPEGKTK
jgi:preprotein translocase subunit SecG